MKPIYFDADAGNVHVPSANTAAIVTLAATADYRHVISKVFASYNSTPTAGRLTITDGGTTVLDLDIAAAGPVILNDLNIRGETNSAVVITLAAGGASVQGKLNVYNAVER